MSGNLNLASMVPFVRLESSGAEKKLTGYEHDEGVALLVSDTGRRNFSAMSMSTFKTSHPQLTLSTNATSLDLCTGLAGAVHVKTAKRGFQLRSDPTNTTNIHIGGRQVATDNGMVLEPGDAIFLEITRLNNIFAVAASGTPKLYWLDM